MTRLFEVAAAVGARGRHIEAAHAIERVLPAATGKQLAMNVSVVDDAGAEFFPV